MKSQQNRIELVKRPAIQSTGDAKSSVTTKPKLLTTSATAFKRRSSTPSLVAHPITDAPSATTERVAIETPEEQASDGSFTKQTQCDF